MGRGGRVRQPDWGGLPRGSPRWGVNSQRTPTSIWHWRRSHASLDYPQFCSCWNQRGRSWWQGHRDYERGPGSCDGAGFRVEGRKIQGLRTAETRRPFPTAQGAHLHLYSLPHEHSNLSEPLAVIPADWRCLGMAGTYADCPKLAGARVAKAPPRRFA